MSNYEHALKIKKSLTNVIRDLEQQVTTAHRDKTGLRWQFKGCGDRCMTFATDCYTGTYGSSSVSSCNSDDLGREIAETLVELKSVIIERTIARAKKKIADACELARTEAEGILQAAQSTT